MVSLTDVFMPQKFGAAWATATQLPVQMPQWDSGAGRAFAPYIALPGGIAYNVVGSSTAKPLAGVRRYRAVGGYGSLAARDAAVAGINSLLGKYDRLWTQNTNNSVYFVQHWKYATITDISVETQANAPLYVRYDIEFTFEKGYWADSATTNIVANLDANPHTYSLTNAGDAPVTNVIFQIVAGSVAISSVTITNDAATVKWVYTGTLAAGKSLEIHCGGRWVKNDGAYDTDGFALDPTLHTISDWMWIPADTATDIYVAFTDGDLNGSFRYIFNSAWTV